MDQDLCINGVRNDIQTFDAKIIYSQPYPSYFEIGLGNDIRINPCIHHRTADQNDVHTSIPRNVLLQAIPFDIKILSHGGGIITQRFANIKPVQETLMNRSFQDTEEGNKKSYSQE